MAIFSDPTKEFLQRNLKIIIVFLIITIGLFGWRLGLLNYIPEIKTPVGVFRLNDQASVKEAVVKEAVIDSSNILPDSIYSIMFDLYSSHLTSFERKNIFGKYKGFKTKDTKGKISDIGTDGMTGLIEGFDNEKHAVVVCLFQERWKKRLEILSDVIIKTGTGGDIVYKGIISDLDISSGAAKLIDCEIVE